MNAEHVFYEWINLPQMLKNAKYLQKLTVKREVFLGEKLQGSLYWQENPLKYFFRHALKGVDLRSEVGDNKDFLMDRLKHLTIENFFDLEVIGHLIKQNHHLETLNLSFEIVDQTQ